MRFPTGIVIRSATPREHETIARVTVEGFTAIDENGLVRPAPSQAVLAEYRDAAGRARDGDLLVAVDTTTGGIVGTASLLWPDSYLSRVAADDEAELRFVTVLPAYRGWGIAQSLTAEALARAAGWGVNAVVLQSRPTGLGGQRVYQRLAFARAVERERAAEANGTAAMLIFEHRFAQDAGKGLSIRLMRPQEQAEVAGMLLAAYRADYDVDDDYSKDIADVAGRAKSLDVWVAVDRERDELVGSITTPRLGESISEIALPGEMDLRLLGVAPSARGRGVATALMSHVVELARTRGASSVMLVTGEQMVGAQRLYDRVGFMRRPERDFDAYGTRLLCFTFDL